MKIALFHGTTPSIARDLMNCKIKIDFGGGEFGQGFYMGDSKRLAKRRAFHKTTQNLGTAQAAMQAGSNTLKASFNLLDLRKNYVCWVLDRASARDLYDTLKNKRSTASFTAAPPHDLIVGPVVGRRGRYLCSTQYKFDSPKSANVLNKQCAKVGVNLEIV